MGAYCYGKKQRVGPLFFTAPMIEAIEPTQRSKQYGQRGSCSKESKAKIMKKSRRINKIEGKVNYIYNV